jgi:Spy/CpxP family protein refolding chaperone
MYHRIVILSGICIANIVFSYCGNAQVPSDRDGLLKGEGMGLASVAEMNGFPGPKQALDLASDLKLTNVQKKSLGDIYNQTKKRASELGQRIIAVEEELNDAFQSGLVSDKTIRETVDQIGVMRSKLRVLHLSAHLQTKAILTPDQAEIYKRLRIAVSKKGH